MEILNTLYTLGHKAVLPQDLHTNTKANWTRWSVLIHLSKMSAHGSRKLRFDVNINPPFMPESSEITGLSLPSHDYRTFCACRTAGRFTPTGR